MTLYSGATRNKFIGGIMKKTAILVLTLCVAMFIGSAAIPGIVASAAIDPEDPIDAVFLQAYEEMAGENYTGDLDADISRTPLYDIELNPLGALYIFSLYGETGYATVVYFEGAYILTEMFFGSEYPYPFNEGDMNIYVRPMTYLVYNDGYFDPETGLEISSDFLESLAEDAYFGFDAAVYVSTETIHYRTRTGYSFEFVTTPPHLTEVMYCPNACVPIASANIIQYYDRYFPDLIPNYAPGGYLNNTNQYVYFGPSAETDALVSTLYSLMGTDSEGTSYLMFALGFTSYLFFEKNMVVNYTDCKNSDGTFNYSTAKQCLENNIPLIVFTTGTNVDWLNLDETYYNHITHFTSTYNHAMAVFGFKEIYYTFLDGTSRFDKYLSVASGMMSIGRGYLNLADTSNIYAALGIEITEQ